MTLLTLTAREIRGHPGRATLTLLSIAFAVGAIVAVSLATNSTRRALKEMFDSVTGRAALEVVAKDGRPFPATVLAEIERTPGVEQAVPVMQTPTILYQDGRRARLLAMGVNPARDKAIRDYSLAEGRFLEEDDDGIMLEVGFARGIGIEVDRDVRLLTRRGIRRVTVIGLLTPHGIAGLNQGGIVFLPLPMAQRLFGQNGKVTTISLVLEESADEEATLERIAERLPDTLTVRQPASRTRLAKETMLSVEQGMTFAAALILMLAVFMILNTFLMNVGERRRQLAILRTIGATGGQVVRLLVGEGFLMGVVGTVLGLPLGLVGAHFLVEAMGVFFSTQLPSVRPAATPFVLAAVLGPGLAAISTYIPARIAGAIAPLEGMRPAASETRQEPPWVQMILGLGSYLVTGVILFGCVYGWLPIGFLIPSGVLFMAGSVLLIAALLGPLAWASAAALSPLLRLEARLARRQLLRRRTRTTLTAGVLYMAVGTTIGLGTAIINNVQDVKNWYDHTTLGDFFISSPFADPATGLTVEMPESLGEEILGVPGVVEVGTIRFANARVADQSVMVIAGQFAAANRLPLELTAGDPVEVYNRLQQGEVVIGTNLAQRAGLKAGDDLVLESPQGSLRLRVAAETISYTVGGLIVYMDRSVANRLLGLQGADIFVVQASSDAIAEVAARLRSLCQEQGLTLNSFAELRRGLDATIAGVVGGLWGLIALTFVVSSFGIANTLTMNVLEQTREIAVLRVIGMTRRQVRKTILAQALILGIISLVTGTIAGVVTAHNISLCNLPLLGHPVAFALSRELLAGCFVAVVGLVLLAAWPPAERASRLSLSIALQYE